MVRPAAERRHGESSRLPQTRRRTTAQYGHVQKDGFKHDPDNNRVRLSKGSNLKGYWSDFLLCEYQTRPDVDLSEVNSVQNVRAVWNGDEWELHFVCKVKLKTNDSTGNEVAGIDLGITNIATVAFPDEYVLYPGNSIKQDKHYFKRSEYDTEGKNGPSNKSTWARRKLADRETHFSTFSQTPSSQSVSNVVLERWQ